MLERNNDAEATLGERRDDLKGLSPGGKGVLAGKQQHAVDCGSSVLRLQPPALLLPARAQGLRGSVADTQA